MMAIRRMTSAVVATALLSGAVAVRAAAPAYDAAATDAWRAERETELKAEDGWLTVAGLFFLRPGANTVGTDPSSDVLLPDGAGIATAGTIEFTPPRRVTLRLAEGVTAVVDDRQATGRIEFLPADRARKRAASRVDIGGVSLQVHRSGDRVAIRLRDPRSPLRTRFTRLDWFPVDPAWAVPARFVPFAEPKRIPTQNILGDNTVSVSPGEVELTLNGTTVRLLAFDAGEKLSFVISDATTGTDTYRLRFLSADKPDANGHLTVDFNRAHNPPCAFNPHTTCPLPVAQNRLKVPVTAGERLYPGPSATSAAR